MKVLSRYIAWQAFKGILLALTIIMSIIMLVDFVEASRNIGADADLNSGQVFLLTALKTPLLMEQTLPFVVLFGLMGALYAMNRRSELIVLRASGLSAWRFLTPAMLLVFFAGILWAVLANPLAVNAMTYHDDLSARYKGQIKTTSQNSPLWLREGDGYGQTIIYAPKHDLLKRSLSNPEFTVSVIDDDGGQVFSHRFDAEKAKLLSTGYWQLSEVVESFADGKQQYNKTVSIPTKITRQELQDSQSRARLMPLWELPGEIAALTKAGFSTTTQQLRLHKLLSLPLTLLAMAVIAAGVSMRLTREGGALRFMLTGAAIGFGVFFIENMIKAFGETGAISVSLAVWLIPVFVLACGLTYLSLLEDG